jgi:signal transduction histidine kinase
MVNKSGRNRPMQKIEEGSPAQVSRAKHPAPNKYIIGVVCCLCLGLLGSALFTFTTLSRLRKDYLSNRGHEISSAIEAQVRGPGRRNNPAFWQSVLESNYATYANSVAFIALLDQNNNRLAGSGKLPDSPPGKMGIATPGIYEFEEPLPQPRNPRPEGTHTSAKWRIRMGLYSADADFIQRMAFWQLTTTGLAIIALVVLATYLLRMLNRFLEMQYREAAEAQLKSLGIMAASLAHEIRNPLGAMKGLTQLAQEELPSDHMAQSQLRTVVNEAERLEKLVTDLLDFAHAKKPRISEFDLTELLSDIKAMLQSRAETSRTVLQFSLDPDPFNLRSDPAGLRQVLLNVFINAIEVSPANGIVRLTAYRDKDHNAVRIQIDDEGEGFGLKDPETLLQPFVTTKARGTGLGLAVSKQIIESLGGSLNLENLPQGGARCSILLPMS